MRRIVHQWRDWLLEYTSGENYELIQKDTQEVFMVVAKNAMDAEKKSQQIIKTTNEERI